MNARSGYETQVVLGPDKVYPFLNGLLFGETMTKKQARLNATAQQSWGFVTHLESALQEQLALSDLLVARISTEDFWTDHPEVSAGITTLEMASRAKTLAAFQALCDSIRNL